jgi:hypothetical protein
MRHGISCPYCGVFCLSDPNGLSEKQALDSHLQACYENVVDIAKGPHPYSRPNPCYMKKNPLAFVDEKPLVPKPPRRMIRI